MCGHVIFALDCTAWNNLCIVLEFYEMYVNNSISSTFNYTLYCFNFIFTCTRFMLQTSSDLYNTKPQFCCVWPHLHSSCTLAMLYEEYHKYEVHLIKSLVNVSNNCDNRPSLLFLGDNFITHKNWDFGFLIIVLTYLMDVYYYYLLCM